MNSTFEFLRKLVRAGEAVPRGKINPEEALGLKCGEKNSKMRRKRIKKGAV
ncbi:MAG: hypothetical protein H6Q42_572 [Deltaproteobacteria bacterium]|nr:hypothetical protein [Deltaproteobacteria bacterium]